MSTPYDDDEPVFPDQTSDDDPRAWGEHSADDSDDDERIRREVPPHHDR
jgi:hypothetical protein